MLPKLIYKRKYIYEWVYLTINLFSLDKYQIIKPKIISTTE